MQISSDTTRIDVAVGRLDSWLDTMRGPHGYGGPVAHWSHQGVMCAGTDLDWRYEGIIDGYLKLWRRTRNQRWLQKARCAADDVLTGQRQSGHVAEATSQTYSPLRDAAHEAACDVGLLLLASALKQAQLKGWQHYLRAAIRNLQQVYIDQLWDRQTQSFQEDWRIRSFVPNKAATVCDALFFVAKLLDEAAWVDDFALPTLDRILAHQVRGGPLDGAIAQHSIAGRTTDTYYPLYIARCMPAMVDGYEWTENERYLEAARRALEFLKRWANDDGSFPTVVYPHMRVERYPNWIAPLGDILRAADALSPHAVTVDFSATRERLLGGQDASGGMQTAQGFAARLFNHPKSLPDVRDVLHVAAWCDKAFRYLAAHAGPEIPLLASEAFEADCLFKRRSMTYIETPSRVEIVHGRKVAFRWHKGAAWPEIAAPEFWS